MLKSLTLLTDRVAIPTTYPFTVPAIASLTQLAFRSPVTFFTGENGTGKSTLLEAIALSYGLSLGGGNRNFNFQPDGPTDDTQPLARALRLGFFTVLDHKFRRSGLFLLDEPEAALSPQRQLAFLVLIHDTLRDYKDAQFIISTHSPVLLGYPGAQILSFDDAHIHEIAFEEAPPTQIVRRFLNDRERFLKDLLDEPPNLFND